MKFSYSFKFKKAKNETGSMLYVITWPYIFFRSKKVNEAFFGMSVFDIRSLLLGQ